MTATAYCDLHMHTCFSDGRAKPDELLRVAASRGLAAIAITDHDNAAGARAATPLAADLGIELVPGIEFTASWEELDAPDNNQDLDILGLFVDLDSPTLQAMERAALDDIYDRIAETCARLTAAGYPLTLADAFAENPRYAGLQQVVDALVHRGLLSPSEALAAVAAQWQAMRPCAHRVGRITAAIHAAGGVAIVAHPTDVRTTDGWLNDAQVRRLVELGIDGLEIYHFKLDADARRHFLRLAERHGLVISGGSDEHGRVTGWPYLGSQPVTQAHLAALRARAGTQR